MKDKIQQKISKYKRLLIIARNAMLKQDEIYDQDIILTLESKIEAYKEIISDLKEIYEDADNSTAI